MSKVQTFLRDRGQRFFAIIGLLSSDHDGERANAAAKATQMLKEAGLTWGELSGTLGTTPGSTADRYGRMALEEQLNGARQRAETAEKQVRHLQQSQREQMRQIMDLQAEVARLKGAAGGPKPKYKTFNVRLNELIDQLEDALEMNDWEQGFIASIRQRNFLTDKQQAKLIGLFKQANISDYEDLFE